MPHPNRILVVAIDAIQQELLLLKARNGSCAAIKRWVRAWRRQGRECQGFESSHFILHQ
jgi:hypothetical protein